MEQVKLERLASKIEQITQSRDSAIALMKANGDFIEYMDIDVLKQDPQFTAELILSAEVGYPCEALCKATDDRNFLIEVAKNIVLKTPENLDWVTGHMFRGDEEVRAYLSDLVNYAKENNFGEETHKTL